MVGNPGPGPAGTPVQPWEHKKDSGEDFDSAVTLKKYGASLIQATVSPFPLIHDGRHAHPPEGIIWKNAVLTVYRGSAPGRKSCRPQKISPSEEKWLQKNVASKRLTDIFDGVATGDWRDDVRRPACRAYDYAFRDILLKRGDVPGAMRKSKEAADIIRRLRSIPAAYVRIYELGTLLRAGVDI